MERWEQGGTAILERIDSPEVKQVIEPLLDAGHYYAQVTSIEPAGEQIVYSLRVDSADQTRMAATRANRSEGNFTVFESGVYTA